MSRHNTLKKHLKTKDDQDVLTIIDSLNVKTTEIL